jgi:acyl dehydratase
VEQFVSAINFKDQQGLQTLVSEEFSDWSDPVTVTQQMINEFAELSGDHMWMHVDEERAAKESPFGCTIAHGFLILSMISKMPCGPNVIEGVTGYRHMMNYGSDKLRFLNAVPVNSQVHARSRISEAQVSEHKTKLTSEIHVHVVDQDKPTLIYELSFVFM